MKNHCYMAFSQFYPKIKSIMYIYKMMFICETAKFAPVWTTILKIRAIFVHQTLTEHALWDDDRKHHTNEVWEF